MTRPSKQLYLSPVTSLALIWWPDHVAEMELDSAEWTELQSGLWSMGGLRVGLTVFPVYKVIELSEGCGFTKLDVTTFPGKIPKCSSIIGTLSPKLNLNVQLSPH